MAQTLGDLYKEFHDKQTEQSLIFSTLYNTILKQNEDIRKLQEDLGRYKKPKDKKP